MHNIEILSTFFHFLVQNVLLKIPMEEAWGGLGVGGGEEFCEVLWKVLGQALGPHWLQLGHGCRPFSLQEMHLRALKESVKQLRNTDILLPWHMGHGMKAKPPQDWHGWWCWALWEGDTRSSQGIGN